ncbi:MAG: HDOD domain-containing protein [Nibricoccus sp.]
MAIAKPSPQKLQQIAQQLPASPQVLAQLNELLMDVNSGLDEISDLLRRDTALAARIIRISNSVAYGSAGGIASIEEAVNRVGFSEVYRLTGLAAAAQMIDRSLPFYGVSAEQLRNNTLVVAFGMDSLCKAAGIDARIGYTAGLMRLAGKLILDHYARGLTGPQSAFARSGKTALLDWEKELFECTNAEAGAIVMTSWHFPVAITEPLRQHYCLQKPTGSHARTACLLNLACGIATELGFGLPGEEGYWAETPEKLQVAGLMDHQVRQGAIDASVGFEAIKGSLD